jgi:hypothetical protein
VLYVYLIVCIPAILNNDDRVNISCGATHHQVAVRLVISNPRNGYDELGGRGGTEHGDEEEGVRGMSIYPIPRNRADAAELPERAWELLGHSCLAGPKCRQRRMTHRTQ